jgi:hypothetical protein
MKVFLGGIAAAFLGIIGMFVFMGPFLHLLAGAIPLMLLAGGAMAAYLGYDEVKDRLPFTRKTEATEAPVNSDTQLREEADRYKREVDRLKAELEKSKTE